jgi:hypothetical protein
MGKKGENLATKEDLEDALEKVRRETQTMKEAEIVAIQNKLDTVVKQNEAIVRSSEEIREQISSRQRMWELKREAAYDIMKLLASFSHVLAAAVAASGYKANDKADAIRKDTDRRHRENTEKLWQLKSISFLLFGPNLADLLGQISAASTRLMTRAAEHSEKDSLLEQMVIFENLQKEITALLRRELEEGFKG